MSGKNYNAGKAGEKSSWEAMAAKGFYRPTSGKKSKERANITKAFSMLGKDIKPRGFDLIDARYQTYLNDPNKIATLISDGSFILYELKTAGAQRKKDLKENFNGLGFTLTANEKHNHSVLGDDGFKFIFLDLKTYDCICINKSDFYTKCRRYSTESIFVNEEISNGAII
jgi:hypothetical protein